MPVTSPANGWTCALELKPDRSVAAGSPKALADAIGRGADLRVYTEFIHEEHIAPFSTTPGIADQENNGLYREVIDFRETYLLDGWHAAGITTLRQPLEPLTGFNGKQPKMSFFLYNADGRQACAQLVLDAAPLTGRVGTRTIEPPPPGLPGAKMSETEAFDAGTSGPSRNFIYEMETYRYFVRDDWTEVLAHDERGKVLHGSFDALEQAQIGAREIKVGLRGLCADLGHGPAHEVFSLAGSGFLHTRRRTHEVLTHPLIRVAPAIPLAYASGNWDLSWVSIRTTGEAVRRTLNPYARAWSDHPMRLACRWFVR